MKNDTQDLCGCSEKFAELCALSTSGELNAEELTELNEHVAICNSCAALLREYTSLAHVGMARLASELASEGESLYPYHEKKAEHRLTASLHAAQPNEQPALYSSIHSPVLAGYWRRNRRLILFAGATAVFLVCIGGAFELGRKLVPGFPTAVPAATALPPTAVPITDKDALQVKMATAQKSLEEITARTAEAEKQIAELSSAKASLLAEIDGLAKKDQTTSDSLVTITQQRDGLQQQLNDTSKSLQQEKQDLNQAQQDRQGALFRAATLEAEVNELHAEVSKTNNTASNDESFLAQDRDIRELMGARQLYIANVFDVQNNGQRSKPFGRVFYTKGKSLIFYAFDLQTQPGYREAKAFQAWGKPDIVSAKPISLGIFYMDNEKNRRWVLKSSDPNVLAQINAVFVTVEPHGGSQKPTGKPFLEAYLHSLPPNHP